VPRPAVDTALLTVIARPRQLLSNAEREAWCAFVHFAFSRARTGARQTFRPLLSHLQWRIVTRDLAVPDDATLFGLTLDQWVGLYRAVRRHAPGHKQARIGAPP
jgi:16S rRNA A1518/A1519 N6-dimethyltransferase RsmA/KsgA/DIM1 with predicted DNA glycosylase/AP lyase activity